MTKALLDTAEAQRLAKIAGMFGSDHDGERAAAAQKFHAALHSRGLTAADLLDRYCDLEVAVRRLSVDALLRSMPKGIPPGGWMNRPDHLRHQSQAAECLGCLEVSDWEREFLQSITTATRLSEKQAACLARIYSRLEWSA